MAGVVETGDHHASIVYGDGKSVFAGDYLPHARVVLDARTTRSAGTRY